MAEKRVRWSDRSWNPITGCEKVSSGCLNCYAERIALSKKRDGDSKYIQGFIPTTHPGSLDEPLRWNRGGIIFAVSMGDLFHPAIPFSYVQKVFDVARRASHHSFVVLTKRSERLVELNPHLPWHENIWQGVSVEHPDYLHRVDHLRRTGARVKVLHIEPLIGRLHSLNLVGIDWVIVGGEHAVDKRRARPMRKEWVQEIRDKCIEADVPFFFKQWSDANPEEPGRLLDGVEWKQYPQPPSPYRVLF